MGYKSRKRRERHLRRRALAAETRLKRWNDYKILSEDAPQLLAALQERVSQHITDRVAYLTLRMESMIKFARSLRGRLVILFTGRVEPGPVSP